jgi:hypothetical protein
MSRTIINCADYFVANNEPLIRAAKKNCQKIIIYSSSRPPWPGGIGAGFDLSLCDGAEVGVEMGKRWGI